jgi:hypothetical protein
MLRAVYESVQDFEEIRDFLDLDDQYEPEINIPPFAPGKHIYTCSHI